MQNEKIERPDYTLLKDLPGLSEGRIIYPHPDGSAFYTDGDNYTITENVVLSNPEWFKLIE